MDKEIMLFKLAVEIAEVDYFYYRLECWIKACPARTSKTIWRERLEQFQVKERDKLTAKEIIPAIGINVAPTIIGNEMVLVRRRALELMIDACIQGIRSYENDSRPTRKTVLDLTRRAVENLKGNLRSSYISTRRDSE